jgi:hypothetical protein
MKAKREKITSMIDFIKCETTIGTKGDYTGVGGFYMQDKVQFIDIDNLEIYSIKELQIISSQRIPGAKKAHYISIIKNDKTFMQKQRAMNREIKLNSILG